MSHTTAFLDPWFWLIFLTLFVAIGGLGVLIGYVQRSRREDVEDDERGQTHEPTPAPVFLVVAAVGALVFLDVLKKTQPETSGGVALVLAIGVGVASAALTFVMLFGITWLPGRIRGGD